MQMDVVALNLFGPVVKSVIQSAWPLFTSPRLYVFSASFVIRNTSLYTKSISEKMKKLSVDLENINCS